MGTIRKLDGRNRITLPHEILQLFGKTNAFEVSFIGDKITLAPHDVKCGICGSGYDVRSVFVCKDCYKKGVV